MRTRFAPSPTGYLHIGGVRTALFNWLLARRHGGQFILRIDDTDAERNRPEALQPILDGFRWLGIDWDEGPDIGGPCGPYFQSQRLDLYRDAALGLLASGHAYPDYLTSEQLAAERKAAEVAKKAYVHRGPHRDTPADECVRLYKVTPTALRLKVPTGRSVVINDQIRGRVEWQTDGIGDAVILRAPDGDGTARALYNFATVVDDIAFDITDVVRAVEHLANTPVQVLAYEALGATLPRFAHVPVVNAPKSNKKMSKRDMARFMTDEIVAKLKAVHALPSDMPDEEAKKQERLNPAMVAFYQALGYLPASLVNYLGRLGWSLDDRTEIMPLATMIANFSLERVNDSPAQFDPERLYSFASDYMKALPIEEKVNGVIPFLRRAGLVGETVDRDHIRRVVEACGDRIKVFSDILGSAAPFFVKDPAYDDKAVEKRLRKDRVPGLLRDFRAVLATVEPFDTATLEEALQRFATERSFNPSLMILALRVATTGVEVGPGVYDGLWLLGRVETLRRIDLALADLAPKREPAGH
jgi:glutamyl-tRNA synthetase